MTFVSRVLLFNSNFFNFSKRGVFALDATQKLLTGKTHFMRFVYTKMQSESGGKYEKSEFKPSQSYDLIINKRSTKKKIFSLASKLSKVDLSVVFDNSKALPRGLLVATFQKLSVLYHQNKGRASFKKEVDFFSESDAFKRFCKILEEELPKMTPSNLPSVLHLVYFNVSPESDLMKKIYKLILDKLHCFNIIDLLEIYCELYGKHFENIKECQSIINASGEYFETYLEQELSYYENLRELPYFISEKNLPLEVKKLITEKFLSVIESGKYHLSDFPIFFSLAFKEPILSLYKSQLLEKLKIILFDHQAPKVSHIFSKIYERSVKKYDFLFDKELCEMFNNNINVYYQETVFIRVTHTLCGLGYLNRESLNRILDSVLSTDISNFQPKTIFTIVSIFARTSFHETNDPNWSKVKSQLESYNVKKIFFTNSNLFKWCKYLTFLGCDTTNLLRDVFNKAGEKNFIESSEDCRAILRLHHYCKKYFPDSDVGLKKKLLIDVLQNSIYKKSFYSFSLIPTFFGGEDYVLYNCLTSHFHFLPVVALLGSDNKPIDLSPYKSKTIEQYYTKNFKVVTNIDHIKRPPGSKLIAFLEYPDYQPFEFRNAPLKSGYLRIFSKYYEGINCNMILLNEQYFTLENDKKLEYLKKQVNRIIEKPETAE